MKKLSFLYDDNAINKLIWRWSW